MTQDERWVAKYNEVKSFIETNKRNPSKHCIEEHLMLNFIKHNRKLLNKGEMKAERVEVFNELLAFSIFNFRPKGKAKCFAGDVGSIGIAFIILFALGRLMLATKDVTWIVFFLVYGIDGSLTIFHRIMLHENLGQAHRKHAYQLMANELKMSHVTVSCIYMVLQLIISLGFIYLCPNTILAHWVYLIGAGVVLAIGYILFMRKYYYLHEQYLKSLEK